MNPQYILQLIENVKDNVNRSGNWLFGRNWKYTPELARVAAGLAAGQALVLFDELSHECQIDTYKETQDMVRTISNWCADAQAKVDKKD